MLELLIALFIGVIAGVIAGLLPGIHTNLISAILISSSGFLLVFLSPIALFIFIVAMSITQSFVDFIPSIYLGAPDEDTVLSTMPGHNLFLKGSGHEAVILTIIGSSIAVVLFIIFIPFFIFILPKIYPFIQRMM